MTPRKKTDERLRGKSPHSLPGAEKSTRWQSSLSFVRYSYRNALCSRPFDEYASTPFFQG
jgi:hypothetical protein